MDTSEPSSATEEEEEKAAVEEQRPRTRSNPEGAEDRTLSAQGSVGSRSEGEGEAASTGDSPQSTTAMAANGKVWPPLAPPLDSKTNALNISQKMIEMFVRTKHKIDKSHEFALVVVNNDVTWLPVTDNVQTIPPPYVVRTILVYSRPACQPPVTVTDQMKKMLQCPYYFFDVLYLHNGIEEKEEETSWKETFAFFSNLDTKGTNYKYEVSLTGPAVELHNCMAKLLAHPLQRPFQTHASYSMLEEEEAPEIEAVV
ncbi:hypothetical protein JD844_034333 [Phrynosoma platyrhinos]|uniref:BRISC and BRCA1-A complex member 1 n=1 Tax=Phrynosoma platyrhinos TaxID=52577 RepID=A0ABQ7T8G4_PHRPL|nr:hypothetical protein JD844_034333 [Phrynosoma platyrhinos]